MEFDAQRDVIEWNHQLNPLESGFQRFFGIGRCDDIEHFLAAKPSIFGFGAKIQTRTLFEEFALIFRINSCLKCGYSLIGNVSNKCPECGTSISVR